MIIKGSEYSSSSTSGVTYGEGVYGAGIYSGSTVTDSSLSEASPSDGSFIEATVLNGEIDLGDYKVNAAVIGLPYTSTLLTFPVEVQTQSGFSIGYKKKIYEIDGCFYRTMNGQYGLKEQFVEPTMYDIKFSEWPDTTNGSNDPYTGLIRLEVDGGWSDEVQVKFTQTGPYPFTVTALQTKIEVSSD